MENLILMLVAVFMQTLTIGQAQWSRYPQYPQYSQQPQYYFQQPIHQQQQQQPSFYQQPQPQQHQHQQQPRQQSFQARQSPEPIIAIALMQGQNVSGIIHFVQMPGTVNCQVTGRLTGLEPGDHGFHIHQYGDMRDGCKSMGGHFNPDGNQHGAPMDNFRHAGDLGNIEADQNGVAELNFIDPRISLQSGPYSILGRGVVVHAKQDDLGRGNTEDSKKTGNAGGRVACGIVALAAVIDDSAK